MKNVAFILMIALIGACSTSTDDNTNNTTSGGDGGTPITFLDLVQGTYTLEDKNVRIGSDGDIYEDTTMLYEYIQEKSDDNTKAYYTDKTLNGFVGLAVINTTRTKSIILFKKNKTGVWDSMNQVLFSINHIVGTNEEIFKTFIQGIEVFYGVAISILSEGNFSAEGTNYTFHSAITPTQAAYSVKKIGSTDLDKYVGISIDSGILKMYQNGETTPWNNPTDVDTSKFIDTHKFAGYPRILFLDQIKNITEFYEQAITISDAGNFSAKTTNYTFHSAITPTQAVYSVKKIGSSDTDKYVGISVNSTTLTMYQNDKTAPWENATDVDVAKFINTHKFASYPKYMTLHSSYANIAGTISSLHLVFNNNTPYTLHHTSEDSIVLYQVNASDSIFTTWTQKATNSTFGNPTSPLNLVAVNGQVYIAATQKTGILSKITIYKDLTKIADWSKPNPYQFSVFDTTPYILTEKIGAGTGLGLYKYNTDTWDYLAGIDQIGSDMIANKLHILNDNSFYMSYSYKEGDITKSAIKHNTSTSPLIIANTAVVDTTIDNGILYIAIFENGSPNKIEIKKIVNNAWVNVNSLDTGFRPTKIQIRIHANNTYIIASHGSEAILYISENSTPFTQVDSYFYSSIFTDINILNGRFFLLLGINTSSTANGKLELYEYK